MKNPNIYLISNASTDLYRNTLSKFVNLLPSPIEFPFYEEWGVSIRDISISHDFEETPKFVYIKCDILDGHYNQDQILGIYAYPIKIGEHLERKKASFFYMTYQAFCFFFFMLTCIKIPKHFVFFFHPNYLKISGFLHLTVFSAPVITTRD